MILKILTKRELIVSIPRQLDRATIYPLVNTVLDSNLDARCSKIIFDFKALQFVYPAGVTVLSNLIEFLKKTGAKTQFINHDKELSDAIRYLDDSGFFTQYLGAPLIKNAAVRPTTLPLSLVEYSRSYGYIGFNLVPWLARGLATEEKALGSLTVCFQEIFNNINDHSMENIGCSYAQHYPNKNHIEIAISDFGIGIPSNVKKREPGLNDQQAIARACEAGFTSNTTVRNRGAGLDVLIQNVVRRNGGTVILHSGGGIVSCTRGDGVIKKTPRGANGFYPGTLIQLILDTTQFVSDDIEEDFEW